MSSHPGLSSLSGPAPMPVLGWRGNQLKFFMDPVAYMQRAQEGGSGVVAFARGGTGAVLAPVKDAPGTVIAYGPEANHAVLSQTALFHTVAVSGPHEHAPFRRLTSGLFSMNDDKHRQQRRLMMPAFHKSRIDAYRDDMVRLTQRTLEGWRPGEVRNIAAEMQRLTLSVANKVLFGSEATPGTLSIGERIQQFLHASFSPLALVPLDFPMTPRRRLLEISTRLDEALRALIAAKRAANSSSGDVLEMLIRSRDEDDGKLTDDELVGQSFLLFFAGHDTTSNGLSWTLFLLAQHPEIAARLHEELHGRLQGEAPTVEQLKDLPYLEGVIKESLRLLPPVPFLVRTTTDETELGGRTLPRHTEVILNVLASHRLESVYPDALRFQPERWEHLRPSAYEYIPFGGGARMCMGATFAMMEMKIVLAMLVQRYRLEMPAGSRVDRKTLLVMSPRQGLPMQVHAQDRCFAKGGVATVRGNIHEMVRLAA